ncbi:hypothetical protein ACFV2B_27565 [Streptomyces lavendulae]|uniref:NucA/NucB deoxyribonuclease domain-containing protein n=1 Tax=Streptomyces lavendulae TaxID=1914 RepID=UPI00368D7BF7
MAGLPEIAANIRKVMDGGPHRYGDRTRGSALNRSTDPGNERDSRNAACPPFRKRPSGTSCDEYPFARTHQGAARSERRDWGWARVPVSGQGRRFAKGGTPARHRNPKLTERFQKGWMQGELDAAAQTAYADARAATHPDG